MEIRMCPECRAGKMLVIRACEPGMLVYNCPACNNREVYTYETED